MRSSSKLVAMVCVLMLPALAVAQEAAPAAAKQPSGESAPARFATRAVIGYMGMIPSVIAGAYIGATVENATWKCLCDDPGLAGAVLGFSAAALIGGATFAAMPSFQRECSYGRRWRRAMTGAALSIVPGALILATTGRGAVIILTPLASPLAAATALSRC